MFSLRRKRNVEKHPKTDALSCLSAGWMECGAIGVVFIIESMIHSFLNKISYAYQPAVCKSCWPSNKK